MKAKKRINPVSGSDSEIDQDRPDHQSLFQKFPFAQALTDFSIFSEQRVGLEGSALDLLISWRHDCEVRLQIILIPRQDF